MVAVGGSGLRRSAVAGLHVSQRSLDGNLHIAFEERKNGPGEVSILYREDPLADRVDELGANAGLFGDLRRGGSVEASII